jgi:exopolyphosphatase/guanosine-5'-triphosphate,3'-diphosphate pyrophosphatase
MNHNSYPKKAIIEIGSNSIKFCVAQILDENNYLIIHDTAYMTRIGENLSQTGLISKDAMKRNEQTIEMLCLKARQWGVKSIIAVGTMALRKAKNSDHFIQNIQKKCNIDIHILSGDDEARLAYRAATNTINQNDDSTVVFDSGGGSTEFIFGLRNQITQKISIDIGAVHITEQFFLDDPIKKKQLLMAQNYIANTFQEKHVMGTVDQLIGLGGAVTTMSAVKQKMFQYESAFINGSTLSRKDVQKQIKMYTSKTLEQRKSICGLQSGREDIILAGACIIDGIMHQLVCNQVIVCDRGLRHGLIVE